MASPDAPPISARRMITRAWPWAAVSLLSLASAWLVMGDERTWQLAVNTLCLTGSVVGLSLALGVPLAVLLVRTDAVARRAALLASLALVFLPLYVQAAGWQAGFGLQGWFTLWSSGHTLLEGFPAAIWIHTAAAIPWVVLIVGLGLWFVEPELEELALLDLSPGQVLARVTLRRAAPAVAAAALWVALSTAGEMTVTNLFLVRTYAEEVYTQLAAGDDGGAWALGVLPGALGSLWLMLLGLLLARRLAAGGRHAGAARPFVFALGRWRAAGSLAIWLALLALVGVPLGNLVYKAGWQATHTADGWRQYWSAGRLADVVVHSPVRFRHEFGWTLLLAALAALASLLLAIPLAWSARRRGWAGGLVWLVVAACLAVPGPVVGLGIIGLFQWSTHPGLGYLYDRTLLAPLLAQTVRALPLATIVLWNAFERVPQTLLDAAAIDGADSGATLLKIVLPLQRRAVAAAGLVAFALAAGDLAASILVVPPGVMTLPIQIFNLIHGGVDDLVAGACLTLVAGYWLLAWTVVRLTVRSRNAS